MPFSAATAASWCRGTVQGDAARTFQTMEAFDRAEAAHLTFIGLPELAKKMSTCPAGGAICSRGLPVQARPDQVLIWVENADLAVAEVLDKLATELALPPVGVHPTAVVDPAANLGKDVRIGPLTVIEAGAQLGDRTVVLAQGFVGQNSVLGSDCFLWPQVVIRERCVLGHRVILHSGCVIGADGFGYRLSAGRYVKIPHIGGVSIGNDCEIGANATVDRGKFADTIIGEGSKLDNSVQVGHNVILGRHAILVSHVAVGGSVRTGDYLTMGGGSVIADHLKLGQGVRVAGFSAVTGDADPQAQLVGAPARPGREYFSELRALHRLPRLPATLRDLEQRIAALESCTKDHHS